MKHGAAWMACDWVLGVHYIPILLRLCPNIFRWVVILSRSAQTLSGVLQTIVGRFMQSEYINDEAQT